MSIWTGTGGYTTESGVADVPLFYPGIPDGWVNLGEANGALLLHLALLHR